MELILKSAGLFCRGKIIDRPNRFTLRAKMNSSIERIYLPNPGRLSTVIAPGREVLCEPVSQKGRKTRFNAFAVRVGSLYVTVNSAFANTIFSALVERGVLEEFRGHTIVSREKRLKDGRIDFVLRDPKSREVYVEVKSCTHVEHGIAKFPDRPTERGRRHLKLLTRLAARGKECCIVFIVQRSDARRFRPFAEVDPEFAELLKEAAKAGVKVRAIATKFIPPSLYLARKTLPLEFG